MKTLLLEFLRLGIIIGTLPNTIANGQTIDAVPLMGDLNWIVSQVNANGATQTDLATLQALIATWGPLTNFTPALAFGGSSVGITYNAGATKGVWALVGTLYFFYFSLLLTNKGAAAGIATISGLPVAANANLNANSPVGVLNCNQVTFADKFLTLTPVPGAAQLQIASTPSATPGPNFLDNTAFVNTSDLFGFGVYPQ